MSDIAFAKGTTEMDSIRSLGADYVNNYAERFHQSSAFTG